jgi:hypothetical protein
LGLCISSRSNFSLAFLSEENELLANFWFPHDLTRYEPCINDCVSVLVNPDLTVLLLFTVENILDRENFTLEELLDEEDILQETKAQNKKLID